MPTTRYSRLVAVCCFAIPSALLLAHAASYRAYFSDDAFIALRYADRLVRGQGLTWTDGERVEGYTDLGWILAIAALTLLRLSGVVAARLLGTLAGVAMVAAIVRAARPTRL
ncbi:MAG: hypothetical protein ACXVDD_30490, partial [Polyangia bacterium]